MADVLIPGGFGFIGSHLTRRCLERGDRVTVLTYKQKTPRIPLPPTPALRTIRVDLRNLTETQNALKSNRFDAVFNLSGYIDHTPYFHGGRSVLDQHFAAVQNLLESIDRSALKAFVQVGSSDEYGSTPAPQREDQRESSIAPYSVGKAAAAHLLQMLHRTESFPCTILRLFLVYGPGQDTRRFIPQVIRGCLSGKPFPVSEGRQQRDFTYADDIVDALLQAAQEPAVQGEVINVASGSPVTIREVLETLVRLCGQGDPQFGGVPYRPGENMALYADAAKAKKLLGWQSRISLSEGLKKTVDYYRSVWAQGTLV